MYVNPDSFLSLGGHAAAVSRAARRLAEAETRPTGIWLEATEEVSVASPTSPETLRWGGCAAKPGLNDS